MSAPSVIRSTAGFRNISLFELNSGGYPIGAVTLTNQTPFTISGSVVNSGSNVVSVAAGATVSGSVGYYGIQHSGAKVLTINDPQPRVLPHVGDDAVINMQILPSLEVASGELRIDKTNDTVDAIIGNLKKVQISELNLMGVITSQRGFEQQVGAMAYSFAQDTDPDSANFGASMWDIRIFPKATVFQRETGYTQEGNERMYSFTPAFCTKHIWGTQFTVAVEGFTRGQIIRGSSQYKPNLVSYLGDGSTKAFPFDSAKPAVSASKVIVWKNGVIQTSGILASINGVGFNTAPALNDVVVVFYESN